MLGEANIKMFITRLEVKIAFERRHTEPPEALIFLVYARSRRLRLVYLDAKPVHLCRHCSPLRVSQKKPVRYVWFISVPSL